MKENRERGREKEKKLINKLHFLFLFLFPFLSLQAENKPRVEWVVDETYNGSYPGTFQSLRWEIPILVRQHVIDISGKLGMPYQDGWRYPLTIRFTDTTVRGAENALAYVMLYRLGNEIRQDLNINLTAYTNDKFNFEKVLAHELAHAMLNDAIGAQAMTIFPIWLHEGLAVFAADQGEQMVRSYVHQYTGFAKQKLINGLDGPHSGLDYAEDYLAMKYIDKTHGPNAIGTFIREIISRKGDVKGAYEYSCNESWSDFLKNAKEFAYEEIEDIGPAKRGGYKKPY